MNVPAGRDCWPTLRAASLADSSHGAGERRGELGRRSGTGRLSAYSVVGEEGRRPVGLAGSSNGAGRRWNRPTSHRSARSRRATPRAGVPIFGGGATLSVRALRPAGGSIHPLPGLLRLDSRQLLLRVIEMVQPQPLNATAAGHITRSTSSATLLRRATRLPGGPARRGGLERASSCR